MIDESKSLEHPQHPGFECEALASGHACSGRRECCNGRDFVSIGDEH